MDDKLKVHVLHTGQVVVDKALPFRNKSLNPFAYTGLLRNKSNKKIHSQI